MSLKHCTEGTPLPPLGQDVLRVYSMDFCPFAQRTRLVLEHKGIPHEIVNVNLHKKPEWFKEKAPFGMVPVVEKGDKIIYESTATCDWIDDCYPKYRLQPSDPYIRAWDRIVFEQFGKVVSGFYSLVKKLADGEKTRENILNSLKFYEKVLNERGGPFFGGDTPAMIDFLMWPHMERLPVIGIINPEFAVTLTNTDFPKLLSWYGKMQTVPAVKNTYKDAALHADFYKAYYGGQPDYDVDIKI